MSNNVKIREEYYIDNTLYDLIKADLIEKVNDELNGEENY